MAKIMLEGYECERCCHKWAPRNDTTPKVCASCHSPYWNVPRKTSEVISAERMRYKPDEEDREKALIEYGQILSFTDISEKQREIMLEQWKEKHRGWFEHMPK